MTEITILDMIIALGILPIYFIICLVALIIVEKRINFKSDIDKSQRTHLEEIMNQIILDPVISILGSIVGTGIVIWLANAREDKLKSKIANDCSLLQDVLLIKCKLPDNIVANELSFTHMNESNRDIIKNFLIDEFNLNQIPIMNAKALENLHIQMCHEMRPLSDLANRFSDWLEKTGYGKDLTYNEENKEE